MPKSPTEKIILALRCADADLLGAQQCIAQRDIEALAGNADAIEETRDEIAEALKHADCPVCSANVHARVSVALNYLHRGKVAKAKDELLGLLPLVQP